MRRFAGAAVFWAAIALAVSAAAQDGAQAFPKLRTVIVGPVPGDPTASGIQLRDALASINPTSCPGDNWRLWIAPGVYDLGGTSLVMKPCVDMEGAGERATTITASGGRFDCSAATVFGAGNTELMRMTIESLNNCALAAGAGIQKLEQVTLSATSGNGGVGVTAWNSSLLLTHVTITVSGGVLAHGIGAGNSSLTLTDVSVVVSGGAGPAVWVGNSPLTIHRSRLTSNDAAILTNQPGLTRVAHSQIEGGLSPGIACIGNYDANLAAVTCP